MDRRRSACLLFVLLSAGITCIFYSTTKTDDVITTQRVHSSSLQQHVLTHSESNHNRMVVNTHSNSEHVTYTKEQSNKDLIASASALIIKRNKTRTSAQNSDHFALKSGFVFPQPAAMIHKDHIFTKQWYNNLQMILSNWTSRYVFMVSSNTAYKEILLNWLISAVIRAHVKLDNILVVSYDEGTHQLLTQRMIKSVHVPHRDILTLQILHGAPVFTQIMMTRLAILRLINHWGFDVVQFDSDAIVVKDPEPLFEMHSDSGIVGSIGKFPSTLKSEWGATLCAGVVMIRSTPKTEMYWKKVSEAKPQSFSDQQMLNYALKGLHIHWEQFDMSHSTIQGECDNGLMVTLLPQSSVCRSSCKTAERESYTVWHSGGAKDGGSKKQKALAGHMWYLDKNWKEKCSNDNLVGSFWLNCIST